MKKIEKILYTVWVLPLPIFIAFNMLYILLLEFGYIDIEFPFDGIIYVNILGFVVIVYLVGWLINSIISLIKSPKRSSKMSKELEAFERIKRHTLSYAGNVYKEATDSREQQIKDLEVLENALKALEIIKNKKCDIYLLMECERLEHYNENDYLCSDQALTQEEFDLLKEVLQ